MKKQIVILTGIWILFVTVHLCSQDQVFSQAENRYLQERPKWSKEHMLDGTFADEMEKWLLDQLPGRDSFVQLRTLVGKALGRTENQEVYFGKKEYLLESFTGYEEELLQKNLDTVETFFHEMEDAGAKCHLMLVPTAAGILKEHLPSNAPELDQEHLLDQIEQEVSQLIRVEDALRSHDQEEIYYRTDHHWTSLGAYYAYASFLEQTGREAKPLKTYVQEVLSTSFYGTNYAKAGLYDTRPDKILAMYQPGQEEKVAQEMEASAVEMEQKADAEEEKSGKLTVDYGSNTVETSLYDRSFLSKRDQYRVFLKGNYPLTTIRTGIENGKKLLLVKDSYANTFVQFLVSDYEEIHMVDLRYFYLSLEDYAKEQGFTDILVLYQLKNFAKETVAISRE